MGGELGGEREAVAPDESVAPFDRSVLRSALAIDGEGRGFRRAAEDGALGRGGYDGADVFTAAVEAEAGTGGQFVVEAGVGEVGVEERFGD